MKCVMCNRPLLASAVPGLQVGRVCARKRGLMPKQVRRAAGRLIARARNSSRQLPTQMDWIRDQMGGHAA